MKIFLDTANLEQIKEMAELGLVDGVTTNPSLIAKEGVDFIDRIKEICEVVKGPISAEVLSTESEEMVQEGIDLSKIDKDIVVKIPCTEEGLKATKSLKEKGIPVNMTLVFSPNQALLACKAGARYISPFVGRLDDIGHDGMEITAKCMDLICEYSFETEVIAASIRNTSHVERAVSLGIDIATIPHKVMKQLVKHPLTDIGIEKFMADWENAKK
ncbi:MAG: fructose-6-phosphate aldolase [Flexistipes sinusarabici]|uniref:Probable transaldolase n=1 Tax=Flexistipes sinusarabici TaxID=2352 RepID=A0A5D0MU86_FLESI|nr:fructose-6-phosphate aldolase [Flexistipes sinusarabici]TYB35638.1 MAG: fructose-6-phosphate aldolase [Flexistipes sinusarabici]